MQIEDKENVYVGNSKSIATSLQGSFYPMKKNESMGDAKAEGKSKSRFGRLLADVTNEMTNESDEKFAKHTQMDEAYHIATEWMREDRDHKAAEKLSQELSDEYKREMKEQQSKGEAAALKCAIDERNRVLAEAKLKREIEAKDSEACKQIILDEVEADHAFKDLCSKDEEYAKKVYALMQDEMFAEREQEREKEEADRIRAEFEAQMQADEKIAQEHFEQLQRELDDEDAKQADADHVYAMRQQHIIDAKLKLQKIKQESADYLASRKLSVQLAREEHRRRKHVAYMRSAKFPQLDDTNTITNTSEIIAQQWVDADAEAEDVEDGICLTAVLPHLASLSMRLVGRNQVEISARRRIVNYEVTVTEENSHYAAEFEFDGGAKLVVTEDDLSYHYCKDSGLLHIYVEKMKLAGDSSMEEGGSRGEAAKKSSLLDGVKRSFKRLFGK